MNIQIIGTKKCRDTQKAERFFSERGIKYHFRDLKIKRLSEGELRNISKSVGLQELLDGNGKEFKSKGMQYKVFDTFEELLENPLLLKTPIVRNGSTATVGYQPEIWKSWLKQLT